MLGKQNEGDKSKIFSNIVKTIYSYVNFKIKVFKTQIHDSVSTEILQDEKN